MEKVYRRRGSTVPKACNDMAASIGDACILNKQCKSEKAVIDGKSSSVCGQVLH